MSLLFALDRGLLGAGGETPVGTNITLPGIGLFALAVAALQKIRD